MDVFVVDVDLADGAGLAGRKFFARHGQTVANDDLALDVAPRVVRCLAGTDVDQLARHTLRTGARTERITVGCQRNWFRRQDLQGGFLWISDQRLARITIRLIAETP